MLASSAEAFSVVKYAGAAYLVFLGIRRLVRRPEVEDARVFDVRARRRLFREGAIVNALNPKTALFFVAFLPQFVEPDRGAAWMQFLALGLVFVVLALISDSLWALAAGTLRDWLRRSRAYLAARRWVSGTVFVVLGASSARSSP